MRRWILAFSVILVGCITALVAPAQRPNTPVAPQDGRFGDPNVYGRTFQDYLYGVVAKVQKDRLVLTKTIFGVPATIDLNRKTKFVRSGKRSSWSELKAGEMVYVQVKKNKKTGNLTAKKVLSGLALAGGS
ncbi:MAG TPA: hypothetical protein VMI06_07950 [Terriglobia bacterium]|nr:hypothetical protein [Terriglobia bacterium]